MIPGCPLVTQQWYQSRWFESLPDKGGQAADLVEHSNGGTSVG
ncbi:hypothetical protein A2U01_0068785 [Trifolium medium]|uniref:Uncharacterized protein n=1 Tax=Trifolium medium TaxID=97028 RepID=A0A392SF24_9FABA|nr:hypothetical protein [Trifolium medium]